MKRILMLFLIISLIFVNYKVVNAYNDNFTKQKVKNIKVVQISYNKNRVSWSTVKKADGYTVYYSTSKNGKYKKINSTKRTYLDVSNVKINYTYYYKVRAYKKQNRKIIHTKYSDAKSKKLALIKPSIKVTTLGKTGLTIKYNKVPYANNYEIYRATSKNGKYKKIGSTSKLYYNDKSLKKYYTYHYKVRAVKKDKKNKYTYSSFSSINWETTGEANSNYKLNLKSVYGDTEAYHPDILFFEKGWRGYKYWLVFTPYPKNDSTKENPHIKVSNDMKKWIVPEGTPNPLDVAKGEGLGKTLFNSDAELVYNSDLDRIECFWRRWEASGETLYMKYTTDGHTWSDAKKVYYASRWNDNPNKLLSPTIVYENGKYKMWYANNCKEWEILYEEFDSIPFTKPISKKVFYMKTASSKLYPWHLDVIKNNGKYEMLFIAVPKLQNLRNETVMSLYYSSSKDNEKWSDAAKVLGPSKDKNAWDNRGIYRSSMFYSKGKYYIFYSASNKKSIKGTSIIYGSSLGNLTPLFN